MPNLFRKMQLQNAENCTVLVEFSATASDPFASLAATFLAPRSGSMQAVVGFE
jgi:hypothetical protein